MIKTKNINFSYGEKKILKNINISLKRGKLTCLLGANGSGKTTIIKTLNGIIKKGSGQIFIDETNLADLKQKEEFILLENPTNWHQVDSLLALLIGTRHQENRHQEIGNKQEGIILI